MGSKRSLITPHLVNACLVGVARIFAFTWMEGVSKVTGFELAEASRCSAVEEKVESVLATGLGKAAKIMGMACPETVMMADQVAGHKNVRQAKWRSDAQSIIANRMALESIHVPFWQNQLENVHAIDDEVDMQWYVMEVVLIDWIDKVGVYWE